MTEESNDKNISHSKKQSGSIQRFIDKWIFAPAHEMNTWQSDLDTTPYQHLFYYDKNKGLYVTENSKTRYFLVTFFLLLPTACLGLNLFRVYYRATGNEHPPHQKYIDFAWLTIIIAGAAMKWEYRKKTKETALLFNQSHFLEKRMIIEEGKHIFQVTRWTWHYLWRECLNVSDIDMVFRLKGEDAIWPFISMLSFCTYYAMYSSIFLLVVLKPCVPVVMASMIVPCGSVLTIPDLPGKITLYSKIFGFAFLETSVMFF